jgi:hypothetical protein
MASEQPDLKGILLGKRTLLNPDTFFLQTKVSA